MSKYNCIILDPDLAARMKLKQATTQVVDFGSVLPIGTINDANNVLSSGERQMDVVFVSARFDANDINTFITQAKQSKHGQDAAYVMVMKTQPQGGADLAANMMIGGDSILCEPYSVDSLVEITRLAARVKKERAGAREKIAIGLLVDDLIKQVDLIAYLRVSGCEPGTSVKKLREMSVMINSIAPENREFYFNTIIAKFEEAKVPPKALAGKKYGGVSSRVRKKMETKIINTMTGDKPSS